MLSLQRLQITPEVYEALMFFFSFFLGGGVVVLPFVWFYVETVSSISMAEKVNMYHVKPFLLSIYSRLLQLRILIITEKRDTFHYICLNSIC